MTDNHKNKLNSFFLKGEIKKLLNNKSKISIFDKPIDIWDVDTLLAIKPNKKTRGIILIEKSKPKFL